MNIQVKGIIVLISSAIQPLELDNNWELDCMRWVEVKVEVDRLEKNDKKNRNEDGVEKMWTCYA